MRGGPNCMMHSCLPALNRWLQRMAPIEVNTTRWTLMTSVSSLGLPNLCMKRTRGREKSSHCRWRIPRICRHRVEVWNQVLATMMCLRNRMSTATLSKISTGILWCTRCCARLGMSGLQKGVLECVSASARAARPLRFLQHPKTSLKDDVCLS